jgi:membrane protease subunit (stomatin/prohibitin family)
MTMGAPASASSVETVPLVARRPWRRAWRRISRLGDQMRAEGPAGDAARHVVRHRARGVTTATSSAGSAASAAHGGFVDGRHQPDLGWSAARQDQQQVASGAMPRDARKAAGSASPKSTCSACEPTTVVGSPSRSNHGASKA